MTVAKRGAATREQAMADFKARWLKRLQSMSAIGGKADMHPRHEMSVFNPKRTFGQHFLRLSRSNTVRYTAMSPEPFRAIWR